MKPGGKADTWISLKTSDRSLAIERLEGARRAADDVFRGVQTRQPLGGIYSRTPRTNWPVDDRLPLLTLADAARLAKNFFSRGFLALEVEQAFHVDADPRLIEAYSNELRDRQGCLTGPDCDEQNDLLTGAVVDTLHRARVRATPDSEACRLLYTYVRRAMVQLGALSVARLSGDYSGEVTDILFDGLSDAIQLTDQSLLGQRSIITVGQASERYLGELLQKNRMPKSEDRYRDEMKHVVAFLGSSTPIAALRRTDCIDFRTTFAKLPPNFARKIMSSGNLRDLAEAYRPGDRVLAWATHSQYLAALNRFMEWAFREDLIDKNYADGIEPLGNKPDGSVAKLPFDDVELQKMFQRPLYTGCIDDKMGFAKPGDAIVRRSRYWAPLIALYSGLRLGEILQLTTGHFRLSPLGREYIVLTPDMRLKNENAKREIPVHPMLKRIGLIEWVERRQKDGGATLFPEVSKDKYGSESSIFSKRFRSDLKHLNLGARRAKLTFHSFRHTFKRSLDRAEIGSDEAEELCGWSRGKKTSKRYGTGLEADRLFKAVEKVGYKIDLSHLYSHAELMD